MEIARDKIKTWNEAKVKKEAETTSGQAKATEEKPSSKNPMAVAFSMNNMKGMLNLKGLAAITAIAKPVSDDHDTTGGATSSRAKWGTGILPRDPGNEASSKRVPMTMIEDDDANAEVAPVRWDARAAPPKKRGSAARLGKIHEGGTAIQALKKARLAPTTWNSQRVRTNWWRERCRERGIPPVPVTVDMVDLAGALLNKGEYKSSRQYLSAIKRLHIKAGHQWSEQHALASLDARRACERGMGPDEQADPLPIEDIIDIEEGAVRAAIKSTWPAVGLDAVVVSCAWLLREIESSVARCCHVELFEAPQGSTGCGWARWTLPSSKTDQKALGVKRSLACACPSRLCPVAAMRRVVLVSRTMSRAKNRSERLGVLLPRRDGRGLAKKNVVSFYEDLAKLVKNKGRITGHSARLTGAMRMSYALMGTDVP